MQNVTTIGKGRKSGVWGSNQAWEKCPAKIQTGKLMRVLQILGYSIFDLKLWGDGGKVAFVDHETGE